MVIDGHSLAFRAFYALPVESFQTRDGQYTNAIHGFIAMLINLLKAEKPDSVAIAFDISRHSFRTREYPEYKGTRGETPEEFKGQIPLLQTTLRSMGLFTIEKEDYEADDILATLSARGTAAGFRVLVVSGDRDTIQLVNDNVTLLYPSRQGVSDLTRYDAEKVWERYGVRPEQYPEIAALVGETSDNLPGVPKVGEKTAVKWINQFGSLDEILAHQDEIGGKVGESLREHAHLAVRNRRLNRLVTDVELGLELDELTPHPFDEQAVRDSFGRLEFRSLLERVLKLYGQGGSVAVATTSPPADPRPTPVTLLDEELEAWLNRESAAHPDGLGLHCDIDVETGQIVTVGIASTSASVELAWQPGSADYAPFETWLMSDAPKILCDGKHQAQAFSRVGSPLGGLRSDVFIAGWLLRPGSPDKTLDDLVTRYLGETLPQADPNQLIPSDDHLMGAGHAAWYIHRLDAAIRSRFDEGTARVFATIEMPLIPVLGSMELRGIALDRNILAGLNTELGDRTTALAQSAYAEIGHEVNLGSPKQLQEVLFEELGMPKTRATKTGFSTDAASLTDLQTKSPHPFLGLLLQHRDATKLRQIVETLEKAVGDDSRIHTTYQQVGTSTGRLSSTDPNLQNIPVRTAEGRRIRQAFCVAEGFETLLTADYSQIEMRIMAHLSGDEGLIEAFNLGEDLHSFVGSRIFGVEPVDVTPTMRSKVKAMSYGLAYGLSAFGLSKQLGISSAEAKQLMQDYFARFGAVRDYLRSVVEQAKEDQYTETLFGRKRFFPELNSPNRLVRENAERAALNAPIQGSAADIMKLAMIGIERRFTEKKLGSHMLLQVHDEIIVEVAPGEWDIAEHIIREEMRDVVRLSVPLDVHVGHGSNWDAAAH
ncbi:DNA polymerase I [Klugiella xanthotipulae]|uniref:DNA polymerase I n=1 Tax=Klugiella xanthotipulae TaxID=244735 RepID=A0A543HSM0_9MICO|nr:DNA polymerase I [Klugiella xanthotipulae]TQM61337.1 DNA polymerase I [Klugiella xanthotipulae]